MYTSSAPRPLTSTKTEYASKATRPVNRGPHSVATEYPVLGTTRRESKSERKLADHTLSGADELVKLLEGQSLYVKQTVFERIARLTTAPKINTVRTLIMQAIQSEGKGE